MDLLEAGTAQFERVVASIPPGAWRNPTPCEMTVREVVDHVAAGNIFATRLLAGASTAEAVADLENYTSGADPLGAVASTCASQQSAFATATATATAAGAAAVGEVRALHHPIGDISLETFFRFRLGDLVVHAWDVAVGAGLDRSLDPAVAEGLWAIVEPHIDDMREMGAYGNSAGNLPVDASTQTRLLDAFGRQG